MYGGQREGWEEGIGRFGWTWAHQFSSVAQLCLTLCNPMGGGTPGLPVHQVLEFAWSHVHRVGDDIQLSHSLLSPSPPAFNLSQHQGLFKWVSSSHQVAKELEFQLQHQSPNEYSGLMSFRMDWLDLLAVQGTLESLLQHHSSKASFLQCSDLFIENLFYREPYVRQQKLYNKNNIWGSRMWSSEKYVREEEIRIIHYKALCCSGLILIWS